MSLETPIKIRMPQRKLYHKAKEEPNYRFYLLYDKICREDILNHAYALAKSNQGAPGVDGRTIEAIKAQGEVAFIKGIQAQLSTKQYRPQAVRRVFIPKGRGRFSRARNPGCSGPSHSRRGPSGTRTDFRGELLRRVVRVSAWAWLSRGDCGGSEVGHLWVQSCDRRRRCRLL